MSKPRIGDYVKCKDGHHGIVDRVADNTPYGTMIFIIVPDGRIYHFPLSEIEEES